MFGSDILDYLSKIFFFIKLISTPFTKSRNRAPRTSVHPHDELPGKVVSPEDTVYTIPAYKSTSKHILPCKGTSTHPFIFRTGTYKWNCISRKKMTEKKKPGTLKSTTQKLTCYWQQNYNITFIQYLQGQHGSRDWNFLLPQNKWLPFHF